MKSLAIDIGSTFGSPFGNTKGIGDLITLILNASFAVSGIIILFLFIFAGISLISGAGSSDPQKIEKGKKAVTTAIIGFIIIFGAYWVIRIIEIITGNNFITQPTI
ncbi:MAG: hypothetical protein CH104c_0692 [Candidatus Woesebacteria bacterium]|nr:MAG: hypothetical protein CH104c_0692 [Candidatus Woesebacteria bacterium]